MNLFSKNTFKPIQHKLAQLFKYDPGFRLKPEMTFETCISLQVTYLLKQERA